MANRDSRNDTPAVVWQTAGLRLGDTGLDLRQQSDPTNMVRLDNARFIDDRNVVRRFGHTARVARDGGDYPGVGNVTTSGWVYGQGLRITAANSMAAPTDHVPTAGRGGTTFEYDGSDVVWTGDRLLVATDGRFLGSSSYWTGTTEPWGIPAYLPSQVDSHPPVALTGTWVETCVTSTVRVTAVENSDHSVVAHISSRATGALVSSTTIGPAGSPAVTTLRVFVSGPFVVALWMLTDGSFYISHWDGNAWSVKSSIDTGVGHFDVQLIDGGFHVLWRKGAHIYLGKYSGVTTVSSPYTFGGELDNASHVPGGSVAVAVAPNGKIIAVFSSADGLIAVTYDQFTNRYSDAVLTADTGPWEALTVTARGLSPDPGTGNPTTHDQNYPWVLWAQKATDNTVLTWEFTQNDPTMVVTSGTHYRTLLASKSVTVGNECFAWLRTINASTLYLSSGAGKYLTSGYADREEAATRAAVNTGDTVHIQPTSMLSPDPLSATAFTWARPYNTGQAYSRAGNVRIGDIEFLPTPTVARYGLTTHLSGSAVKGWDGVNLLDTGFQDYPVIISATPDSSGGSLTTSKLYQWRVYPVRYNARGERTQGAALTGSATTGGSDTEVVLHIGTLPSVEAGVTLEIYRTEGGGTTFYLEGTVSNDTTPYATFTSTMSDANLIKQPADPFATGVGGTSQLENWGPIGCTVLATIGDRLWGAGGQVPAGTAQFSKLKNVGEGVGFDDLGGFQEVNSEGGAITSIAGLNGSVVAFETDRVNVFADTGPDNFGAGSFGVPQFAAAAGAITHFGTALIQLGLLYWGDTGPLLLDLGFRVNNIGLPIRPLTSGLNPTGVRVDRDLQEVVWYTSGGTAVLMNYVGVPRWASWTGLLAAGVSTTGFVTPDGVLMTSDADAVGDGGAPFAMVIESGDVRPEAILTGHTLVRAVGITGDWQGQHNLRFRVFYDGSPLWSEEWTWEPEDLTWLTSIADVESLTPAQVDALGARDQSGGYGTSRRVRRVDCHRVKLQVSDISSDNNTFAPFEFIFELGQKPGLQRVPVATIDNQ